jgi:hypothetical protein
VSPFNSITVSYNNDTSSDGAITGAINGSNTVYTLSAQPVPPTSVLFAVNGIMQAGFTVSGATVTLAVAPHAGSLLNAIYQTA